VRAAERSRRGEHGQRRKGGERQRGCSSICHRGGRETSAERLHENNQRGVRGLQERRARAAAEGETVGGVERKCKGRGGEKMKTLVYFQEPVTAFI